MFAIQPLNENHLDFLIDNFEGGTEKFVRYMQDAVTGERDIAVAVNPDNGEIYGYITLLISSQYPLFKKEKCPEIVDLIVLPKFRNKGAGAALLSAAENAARMHNCKKIGLGVGLGHEYGPAQKLYTQRGYVADGNGLHNNGEKTSEGDTVILSEHTVIMMIKDL